MVLEHYTASARWCHYAAQVALLLMVQPMDADVGLDLSCGDSSVQLVRDVHYITSVLGGAPALLGKKIGRSVSDGPLAGSGYTATIDLSTAVPFSEVGVPATEMVFRL